MGKGTVKRELDKLCAAGLLTISKQGNQNHYQANSNSPIFAELKAITQKTFGVVDILKTALESILADLELAFVYGSIAKGEEHAESDIDLMIVGQDVSYTQVMELLLPAEQQLGRKINPSLYSQQEFIDRLKNRQNFIVSVLDQKKMWLIGKDVYTREYKD